MYMIIIKYLIVGINMKIYGFQKCTYVDKKSLKIRLQKIYLNAITTALTTLVISSLKQTKCCNICPLENFKKIERTHIFICQPAGCQQQLT